MVRSTPSTRAPRQAWTGITFMRDPRRRSAVSVSCRERIDGQSCCQTSGGSPVRFGIFYEHQLPRPWSARSEYQVLQNSLAQIELADRLGYDYAWVVEHHFLEKYSHSSAPEVFLGAASQRTQRLRLGHGIVQIPPQFNHPARVAERIAALDLVSHGRVEFGTGESSSQAELGGFGVDRELKRAQWEE